MRADMGDNSEGNTPRTDEENRISTFLIYFSYSSIYVLIRRWFNIPYISNNSHIL